MRSVVQNDTGQRIQVEQAKRIKQWWFVTDNRYLIWVRINAYQTANTIVYAHSDYQARQLAEAQYGIGSVLNYTLLDD